MESTDNNNPLHKRQSENSRNNAEPVKINPQFEDLQQQHQQRLPLFLLQHRTTLLFFHF
mgnify:CR=1 FL=1